MARKLNRRQFLEQVGSVAVVTIVTGAANSPVPLGLTPTVANAAEMTAQAVHDRCQQAYYIRHQAALAHSALPLPVYPINGDDERYSNKIASFTKCLPHNQVGEVNRAAYAALRQAVTSSAATDFERIPLGGQVKFANPLASYAFELEGYDPHRVDLPPPQPLAAPRRRVR